MRNTYTAGIFDNIHVASNHITTLHNHANLEVEIAK